MGNNIKAFVLHLIYVILTLVFTMLFVFTGPSLGKFTTSLPIRIILIILFIAGYILIGVTLNSKAHKRYDFCYGLLIALVGIIIVIYVFYENGINLMNVPIGYEKYSIPFNIFFQPIHMMLFFLGIKINGIIIVICKIITPSLLIGIGLKVKRKINMKKFN